MKLSFAILAAGKGTRMGELTETRNKCMLEYKGRSILSYIVDTMIYAGAEEIILTVKHGKDEIIKYLSVNYPTTKFKYIEENLEGTGKSINHLRSVKSDYYFIMMGDQIFDSEKIAQFVANFRKNPANYILSRRVEDPRKYGVLEVEGNRIKSIIEKPENPPSNLINLGIYIFDRSIFNYTKQLKKSIRGEYEITDAIQAAIDGGLEFKHFIYENLYLDFTSPKDLL